jgi:hypothetical protein
VGLAAEARWPAATDEVRSAPQFISA